MKQYILLFSFITLVLVGCEPKGTPFSSQPITSQPIVDRNQVQTNPNKEATEPSYSSVPVKLLPVDDTVIGQLRGQINTYYQKITDPTLDEMEQKELYIKYAKAIGEEFKAPTTRDGTELIMPLVDLAENRELHIYKTDDLKTMENIALASFGVKRFRSGITDENSPMYHVHQIYIGCLFISTIAYLQEDIDLEPSYKLIDKHLSLTGVGN